MKWPAILRIDDLHAGEILPLYQNGPRSPSTHQYLANSQVMPSQGLHWVDNYIQLVVRDASLWRLQRDEWPPTGSHVY
jgi:hypothetical protein